MINIDITPIKIINKENNINKEIYRLRILFPNNIGYKKKTGFTIDN